MKGMVVVMARGFDDIVTRFEVDEVGAAGSIRDCSMTRHFRQALVVVRLSSMHSIAVRIRRGGLTIELGRSISRKLCNRIEVSRT